LEPWLDDDTLSALMRLRTIRRRAERGTSALHSERVAAHEARGRGVSLRYLYQRQRLSKGWRFRLHEVWIWMIVAARAEAMSDPRFLSILKEDLRWPMRRDRSPDLPVRRTKD